MSKANYVLFDNNIFRRLLKREDKMSKQDLEWRSAILEWLNAELLPYYIVFTPLGFLEAVGQKINKYPSFNFSTKQFTTPQLLNAVIEESKQFFSDQEYLSIEKLRVKAEIQLNYTSTAPALRRIYDDSIGRFCKTEGAIDTLHDYLAYDALQTYNYGDLADTAHLLILREILRAISNGNNISPFRVMNRMHLECHEMELRNANISNPPVFKIKLREDLLDADWLHLATFGLMQDGSMNPIHVVTSDPEKDVINRISWAKLCWTLFLTEIANPNRFDFVVPKVKMGTIYLINQKNGPPGKRIEVSNVMSEEQDINKYATWSSEFTKTL